jgi:hypothetical protein
MTGRQTLEPVAIFTALAAQKPDFWTGDNTYTAKWTGTAGRAFSSDIYTHAAEMQPLLASVHNYDLGRPRL